MGTHDLLYFPGCAIIAITSLLTACLPQMLFVFLLHISRHRISSCHSHLRINTPFLFSSIYFHAIMTLSIIKKIVILKDVTTFFFFFNFTKKSYYRKRHCGRQLHGELPPLLTTLDIQNRVTTGLTHAATAQAHQAALTQKITAPQNLPRDFVATC